MKTFIFLFSMSVFSLSPKNGFSQNTKIEIADNQLLSVDEVFKMIKNQTDYTFIYRADLFKNYPKVSLKKGSIKAGDLLEKTLSNGDFIYEFSPEHTILIKDKVVVSNVQQLLIKGNVVDKTGMPLPGASVIEKGTNNGVTTDFDGDFKINVSKENTILVVSFLGYLPQEVTATSASDIKIVLKENAENLDEVLVVAYGEQSKSSFTGSAVGVDLAKVEEMPTSSFQETLQGNVSGVQMSSASGQPGYSQDILIRGVGSINADSNPLYVVDGIPVVSGDISTLATSSNTIAGINSKDIETITVLKDASATSIYGSRGANGVILITTKKGKSGKTKFDFSTQYGVSEMIFSDRNKLLNTAESLELLIESRVNIGESYDEAEQYIYDNVDENVDTDWKDVITRTGQYKQYGFSASGGNENTVFYSSVGIYDQESVIIGVDYKKLNAKLNVNHQATDKLSMNFGVSASNQVLHTISEAGSAYNPVRAMYREVPWQPVYNEDGSYNTDILLTYNPVGLVEENERESKLYGILGNIGVNYDFTENLSFETKANIDFNLADEFQYDNPYFGAGRNDGGRGQSSDNIVLNWNVTNLLKYKLNLNEDNTFNFLLGQEAQKINSSSVYAYASNYGAEGLTTLDNASVYKDASSTKTASSLSSLFFNVSYSFKNKYYLNVTGRRDGSSRFGSDVRYANFGSVGAGWNIDQEVFMKDVSFISKLRLRSSYGVNGNQEIGDFASRGLYSTGDDYNGEPGYSYSQQSNPSLTWEKNKPFNVGLDFGLFNRLSGTVEYYTRKTSNLLFEVPISSTNGLTSYLDNVGEMRNSGVELSLSARIFDNPNGFSWKSDFNITTNTNEITKLTNDESIVGDNYIREVGSDFYTFYMPGYAGVDSANGNALWYTDGTETATTSVYSEAESYEQGSALPNFYAGFTNTFSYKNFSLSVMVFLNEGNKVYDTWGRYVASDGSAELNDRGNLTRKIYENRWQQPGDITDVPKVVWGNTQSGLSNQHSTRFLYDGTYLRLRDITLAYQFPSELVEKLKVSNIRFYLKGTNTLTWVKDKGLEIDPEVGIDGTANLRIPISRQFLMGLDFSF
ncbi:TonB-dependent receptor [uncultured Formosa sp.]|uniref:SusC/RagA family TonB-linked outer membrane protein n=1 Tax=uncultured Formosa sp. TaxID=255435 RepID=UPI00261A2292|nr:TonB-dependent receptor [uncultured Formosa sp.]